MYRIEWLPFGKCGSDEWTTEGLGDPDEFETVEEAEEAISEMLCVGIRSRGGYRRVSEYYRVSEIEEV